MEKHNAATYCCITIKEIVPREREVALRKTKLHNYF
jgi:hypothetical protein